MRFEGDTGQTRVKNSSFCDKGFLVEARTICLIFFLLERACQDAGHHRVLFLNCYLFSEEMGWKVQ